MKKCFGIVFILSFSLLHSFAQTPEEIPTEKDNQKDYKNAVRDFGMEHMYRWWNNVSDPPESFTKLSYKQRKLLRENSLIADPEWSVPFLELLQPEAGDKICDLGMGFAHLEEALILQGVDSVTFYGLELDSVFIEISPRVINYAQAFIPFYNAARQVACNCDSIFMQPSEAFEFIPVLSTTESTMLPDASVDKLVIYRTFHHLPEEFIPEMLRILKPGGSIVISDHVTPKENSQRCTDSDDRIYYLTEDEIMRRMEDAGCEFVDLLMPVSGAAHFLFRKP